MISGQENLNSNDLLAMILKSKNVSTNREKLKIPYNRCNANSLLSRQVRNNLSPLVFNMNKKSQTISDQHQSPEKKFIFSKLDFITHPKAYLKKHKIDLECEENIDLKSFAGHPFSYSRSIPRKYHSCNPNVTFLVEKICKYYSASAPKIWNLFVEIEEKVY